MYRYLHQRNHLCSKIKLILSINGHKQINSHRNAKRNFFYKSTRYTPVKNYFRLGILAEVEQLFHKNFNENFQNKIQKIIVTECKNYFSLHTVGELIKKRKLQFFLQKIVSSSNMSVAVRENELLAANT